MNRFSFLFLVAVFSIAKKTDAQTIERQTIGAAQMLSAGDFLVAASVGETAREAAEAGSFFVQQGFEQPSGKVTVSSDELPQIEVFFKVFPNPTDGFLTVELKSEKALRLGFSIFDVNGKMVAELQKTEAVSAGFSSRDFDVSGFAAGPFALVAVDEKGQPIRAVWAIKN